MWRLWFFSVEVAFTPWLDGRDHTLAAHFAKSCASLLHFLAIALTNMKLLMLLLSSVSAAAVPALPAVPAAYDEAIAQTDIWLNQATSCGTHGIANWTCGRACENAPTLARYTATNKLLDTMAIVARQSNSECVVVFRGSKGVANTLEDLFYIPENVSDCAGCKAHSGFLDDWRSLKPTVMQHLTTLGCQNSSLAITGHSLGAAMAALAAYELAKPMRVDRVYTYGAPRACAAHSCWLATHACQPAPCSSDAIGVSQPHSRSHSPFLSSPLVFAPFLSLSLLCAGQPRAGNAAFAAAFNARLLARNVVHYRVVDYRDPVPHLPLKNMFQEGWVHTGHEVYYRATKLGSYATCVLADDKRCSAQWNVLQGLAHICDHCSYLGMSPCQCGATKPQCEEPQPRVL